MVFKSPLCKQYSSFKANVNDKCDKRRCSGYRNLGIFVLKKEFFDVSIIVRKRRNKI